MTSIVIDNIILTNFDENVEDHIKLYTELVSGSSKSDMIHQINERLINSREFKDLEFDNAYIMYLNSTVIGYLYLSGKRANKIYVEMSLLKEFRGKHIGSYLLDAITNYICRSNEDLKEIRVSIDKSNVASMKMVENAGYFYDDDVDFQNDKIDFIRENQYYKGYKR